jgi:hypothetical protein
MDTTALIALVIVALVVIVGVVLYTRRRRGPILMSPPPSEYVPPPAGRRARPPETEEAKPAFGEQPTGVPPETQPQARPTRRARGVFPESGAEPPEPGLEEASPSRSARGGAAPDKPAIPTEAVRFTAFHPKEAAVETWYTLLVYSHVEAALAKVQADAAKFKDEMGGAPREVRSSAPAQLARGTEITIVPTCEGVIFNPERDTFKWVEDVHRSDFRFRAGKDLADSAANIVITVFVGPLIVATIKGGILFSAQSTQPTPGESARITASLYRSEQIFPSYSHADEDIVIACRNAYKALGFEFLRDRDTLRPGEDWNAALMQMIDRADIFQLFWSKRSANSKYCRQEWEYALNQAKDKGGAFVRPVYWEQPMIPPPPELGDLHFAYVPLAKPDEP